MWSISWLTAANLPPKVKKASKHGQNLQRSSEAAKSASLKSISNQKEGVFTENCTYYATTLAFDIKLHLVFIQNVCLIKDSAGPSVNFWKSSKDKLARSVWHYFWISHLLLFQIHFHLMIQTPSVTFKNVL